MQSSPVPFLPPRRPALLRPPSRPLPTLTGSGPLGLGPRPAPSSPRRLLPAARPRHFGASCPAAGSGLLRWRARAGTGQVGDVHRCVIPERISRRAARGWGGPRYRYCGGSSSPRSGAEVSARGREPGAGGRGLAARRERARLPGRFANTSARPSGARECSAGAAANPLTERHGWVVCARPGGAGQGWAPRAPLYCRGGNGARPGPPQVAKFSAHGSVGRRSSWERAENFVLGSAAWLHPGSVSSPGSRGPHLPRDRCGETSCLRSWSHILGAAVDPGQESAGEGLPSRLLPLGPYGQC